MFDLMEGFFGDGEMDLARPVAGYLEEEPRRAEAFLAAYLGREPARPGLRERLAVYLLRDRLIIWEYVQRRTVGRVAPREPRPRLRPPSDPDLTLREWVEPYLAEAGALTARYGSGALSAEA